MNSFVPEARKVAIRRASDISLLENELGPMTRALAVLFLGFAAAGYALIAPHRQAASNRHAAILPGSSPAVLELYQSQGCSSCPPALEVLRQEADRPDVIALSFAVTYWDQLGWKDSFAQPAFTRRQWDYAHANAHSVVATPQLIVNGRGFVNGGDKSEVEEAIERYRLPTGGPSLQFDREQLIVGSVPGAHRATVWLVSYDPRTLQVPIRAGENDGRTLAHRNIVRTLEALGAWSGAQQAYRLPPEGRGLGRAILVQSGTGGPIIAARRLG